MDDIFETLSNHITDRMIYIFCIGIIVGMCSSIVSKILQDHFPIQRAYASTPEYVRPKLANRSKTVAINGIADPLLQIPESVPSYIVVSPETGEILFGKAIDTPRPVASLTKLMTAVISIDLLSSIQSIRVTREATEQIPTNLGMQEGERLSLTELLSAILLTSANDGAQVLANHIDEVYGHGAFLKAMNMKAEQLGMKNTQFDNAQGLDSKDNFSTSRDLAILGTYILSNYPEIQEIVTHQFITLNQTRTHHGFNLYNWNGLLGVYPGIMGMKTGNTPNAGKTAVYVAKRESDTLLIVILGASSTEERDLNSVTLFNEGFQRSYALASYPVVAEQLRQKYLTWPHSSF